VGAIGKTLKATGTGGIDIRFLPDGSVSAATFGINLLLTIPQYGAVFLDVGRAQFLFDPHIDVLFHAGPASTTSRPSAARSLRRCSSGAEGRGVAAWIRAIT
jgi:hypothetical protein